MRTKMLASHLEFLVEEPSMEAFLGAWLPKFLPEGCSFGIRCHQGKHALLRNLPSRLRGYAAWLPAEHRIVVVVDRDNDDCHTLKSRLEDICAQAPLRSRRASGGPDWQVVTRIAIEELEAWYFGNWKAVRNAYPRVPPKIPRQARYRNPDAIAGGTWEAFEQVLQKQGYFREGLAKLQAAGDIGEHFDPKMINRSHSFAVFRNALAEAVK